MRLRRKRILSVLRPGEVAPTMTCFPLMGVGDFVALPVKASPVRAEEPLKTVHLRGPVANSAYIPDEIINPHPRFGALTKNIRVRYASRGGSFLFHHIYIYLGVGLVVKLEVWERGYISGNTRLYPKYISQYVKARVAVKTSKLNQTESELASQRRR